jgi:hypothetical protein
MFDKIFFSRKSCLYFSNVGQFGRARQTTNDNIIRRMRFACWITKATNAYSESVILLIFSRQYWLHEGTPMLGLYYVAYVRHIPIIRRRVLLICDIVFNDTR